MSDQRSVVVVGVDLSPESEAAARQALEVCRRGGHELVLVHSGAVVELPPVSDSPTPAVRDAVDTYRAQLARALEQVRARLADLRERLSNQGVTVSQVLVEDDPPEGLCDAANQLQARLVVVGARGGGALPWRSMGNVAHAVVRACDTDVLVARPGHGPALRMIAVGTDFSASAERALEVAVAIAPRGAQVDVVHCAGLRPVALGGFGVVESLPADLRQALVDDLRVQGEQLIARHQRDGVTISFDVTLDGAVAGLAHWAETRSCDLLAVGSHGRRGLRRLLLGSVSESVLARAPCSVLVARGMPASAGR